jgi:NTP pyrophosphatase (non-canonical NTP hydrolase)
MAQFKITLPADYKQMVADDTRNIYNDIAGRALPDYTQFVNNLMKTMATPAEELHHAGTGIAGEGGEILDATKKVWVYGKPLDVAHLVEELGDMRFYYQAMLNMLGMTDAEIVAQNMKKLRVRYADGKYSDAQANARADKALSAVGAKGTDQPAPRRFMGQAAPAPVDANGSPININDVFDRHMNESLRQLKRDEQP